MVFGFLTMFVGSSNPHDFCGRKPTQTQGEHNSPQEDPRPNSWFSCCEATALTTDPICYPVNNHITISVWINGLNSETKGWQIQVPTSLNNSHLLTLIYEPESHHLCHRMWSSMWNFIAICELAVAGISSYFYKKIFVQCEKVYK